MTELHGCSELPLGDRPIDWKAVAAAVHCAESEHGAAMPLGGRSLEQLVGPDWGKAPPRPFTIISASVTCAGGIPACALQEMRLSCVDSRKLQDLRRGLTFPLATRAACRRRCGTD